ncbi:MAG: hypothetical protein RLN88_15110 [Ekhidna sp.]|uniref:hypothetical protein n=1 Tax=Ekhidna sp. TaxID=2608089 RepID=UPI0032F06EE9
MSMITNTNSVMNKTYANSLFADRQACVPLRTNTIHMKNMTVLKAVSILHLILSTLWSIAYYSEMDDGKGWGVLIIVGLYAIGIAGLLISWILKSLCQKYIQDQPMRVQNLIEIAVVAGFIVFVALRY